MVEKRRRYLMACIAVLFLNLNTLFAYANSECMPAFDIGEGDILYFYVEYGKESYFKITITDDELIPDGSYKGWCVQTDVIMTLKNHHSGAIYSSYNPDVPNYFKKDGMDKWKMVNYLLNHKDKIATFLYDTEGCIMNKSNLQDAIWYITCGTPFEKISSCAQTIVDYLTSDLIQLEIDEFCPQIGDVLVVFIDTYQNDDDPSKNVQHIIIEFPIIDEEDPPYDEPKRKRVTGNTQPTADGSKKAPYRAFSGEEIIFDGSKSYDYDGWIVDWNWSFSDGIIKKGEIINHTFYKAGTYHVYLNVTDDKGSMGQYKTTVDIYQPNNPPSQPIITGETECETLTIYNYTISSTDLDNDTIRYLIDVGDGSDIYATEFYSNNTTITISHIWETTGIYLFKVYAEDENGAVSAHEEMTITIAGTDIEETTGDNIPGFELVNLAIALGVAFILFKRRRK